MKKNKEHKKGESTIGKIIYGFLLFMPLFAIGLTCGYAMFNKNAYLSNGAKESETTLKVSNSTSIIQNSQYLLKYVNQYEEGVAHTSSPQFYYTDININWSDYGFSTGYNWNQFQTREDGFIYLRDQNNYQETQKVWGIDIEEIIFTLDSISAEWNFNLGSTNLYFITITKQSLTDVFYYSVDKVTESPLFSWATNSIIYTTMNATCNQLSITTPFIPLLMSYWLIISIIYFLYDIALMLIWLLHNKIHELQESF